MNLHDVLKSAGRKKLRKRIGRGHGSGHGGTSGRGHKGGGSRAGWRKRPLAEGGAAPIFRRLPKRGFSNVQFATKYHVVNVGDLEEVFDIGAHVTVQSMLDVRLISSLDQPVKVLGDGELKKKLVIEAAKFSKSAVEKIKAAGGDAKMVTFGRAGSSAKA